MTPLGQEDSNEPRLRPFGPPKTSNSIGLATIFLVLLTLAAAYAGYQWFLIPITSSSTSTASETTKRNPSAVQSSPSYMPAKPAPAPAAQPDARVVTKCVANGKTSYGDNDCAPGAATTEVTARSNLNLVAGLKPEQIAAAQRLDEQAVSPITVAQANAAPSSAAECHALNEKIASLDAMARQPQSVQTQDWIRGERKKARDRQFQIQCG